MMRIADDTTVHGSSRFFTFEFQAGYLSATPNAASSVTKNMPWRMGCLPETLEESTPFREASDGSPTSSRPHRAIDIGEGGKTGHRSKESYAWKLIGAVAVEDEGVLDWLLVGIGADHFMAGALDNVADVASAFPDLLVEVQRWLLKSESGDCMKFDLRVKLLGLSDPYTLKNKRTPQHGDISEVLQHHSTTALQH